MPSVATPDATVDTPAPAQPPTRAPLVTFVVALVVGAGVVLLGFGRHRWFALDDWDFLAHRSLGKVDDLFRPHNEHWSTVPVVAWRLVWAATGLHHYWAYQALVVTAHVVVIVLLRAVMRRAGVRPWTATLVALGLLLFGAGNQNIVWAFQIGFVGAMAFGLGHLLMVDHDGPIDRRDLIGLGLGLLAVMSSGIGVSMVVVAGVAALLRRGWRAAALHTVPLAVVYVVWLRVEDVRSTTNPLGATLQGEVRAVVEFAITGIGATFGALASVRYLGFVLAGLLVVGLAVAWLPLTLAEWRRKGAAVTAMLVGLVVFYAISGSGRWWSGSDYARSSRYLYLGAAFVLPAIGVAADALMRRWRALVPAVVALLVIGIVGNIVTFRRDTDADASRYDDIRVLVLNLADRSIGDEVDPRTEPDPRANPGLTIGWLRHARADGDVPDPPPLSANEEVLLPVRLGFVQRFAPPPSDCRPLDSKIEVRPAKGTVYGIAGVGDRLTVTPLDDAGVPSAPPVKFDVGHGRRFVVQLDGLHLQLKPGFVGQTITFCQSSP
ncbi:MAG: hypothetical protein ACXWA3_03800 [Acidimicrobiales bacterium]